LLAHWFVRAPTCCPARQYHRYKKIATEIHGSPPFPGFSSDA
jgi:hypothetical protein